MSDRHLSAEPGASPSDHLRQRIADGSYRVDPGAVADAIIERLGGPSGAQALCSKMLVAPQAAGRDSGERQALARHDVA
jgi:Anti-sigma-28 factor, FlgM